MMLILESDGLEETGTQIEPVTQREQPYEQDGSAEQPELPESAGPQRRRGECASKSVCNGGGCEDSHHHLRD